MSGSEKIMRLKRVLCFAIILLLGLGLSACKKKEVELPPEEAYLLELDDGRFYLRHEGYVCERPYLGETTYLKGSTSNWPDVNRVLWFKDDFEKIPTFTKGDSLILYTEEQLTEVFCFERFKDIGYSIGLRGASITPSNRLQLSTNPDAMLTYPYGDTDQINDLQNENVIIDKLGGVPLRAKPIYEGDMVTYTVDDLVTEYGTVKGLAAMKEYEAEVYSGTVLSKMVFTADVRILGSFETYVSNAYEFESERIIRVEIPEWFKSGYYMVNGQGLFRYISDDYTEDTDMNEPNVSPVNDGMFTTLEKTSPIVEIDEEEDAPDSDLPLIDPELWGDDDELGEDEYEDFGAPVAVLEQQKYNYRSYYIDETDGSVMWIDRMTQSDTNNFPVDVLYEGTMNFRVRFLHMTGQRGDTTKVEGILQTPDGRNIKMKSDGAELNVTIDATVGTYNIKLYDLQKMGPDITIRQIQD